MHFAVSPRRKVLIAQILAAPKCALYKFNVYLLDYPLKP